jgi:hypothetical protein
MPENNAFACDCERDSGGVVRELGPGDFVQDRVQVIKHRPSCPLGKGELPPLGVCVSDTAGATGKISGQ